MLCPTQLQWREYALGLLSEEAIELFSCHLESCSICEALLPTVEAECDTELLTLRKLGEASTVVQGESLDQLDTLLNRVLVHNPFAQKLLDTDSPVSPSLGTGSQLGPYRLLEKLGEGGMAVVYQARHEHTGRLVALKLLKHHRLTDAEHLARFRREMLATGSVEHGQVVQALDAGTVDGQPYLAIEYVRGETFGQRIAREGRLPVELACHLIAHVAEVLAELHRRGVVHRDLKPSNLMLCASDTNSAHKVKILDLGLARLLEPSEREQSSTGTVVGTADYISPEQSLNSHTADSRSDIYSLGCTLYCLLHGRPPFSDPGYATFTQKALAHVHVLPENLHVLHAEIPVGLAQVVDRMLAKAPSERFQTATAVAEALRVHVRPAESIVDAVAVPQPAGSRKHGVWALFLAGLLLPAVALGVWWSGAEEPLIEPSETEAVARVEFPPALPNENIAPLRKPLRPALPPAVPPVDEPALGLPPAIAALDGKVVAWPVAGGGNGHFYLLSQEKALWTDANSLAIKLAPEGYRSYLVSITTVEENVMVANRVLGFSPVWIGLTDSEEFGGSESQKLTDPTVDGWHWLSGEPVGYTAWGPGRPQHVPEQDFVFMYSGGAWDDGNNFALSYIVEIEPVE